MSRSVKVPAGIFDSLSLGFAQVEVVASVGAKLDQVGALRLYIKQSHIHESKAISGALAAMFGENPPCATWIGVASLANDEFLVEVEPSMVFLCKGIG